MKLFLCRHGETTGDIEGRYGGDYEDNLTYRGRSEAEELALKLKVKKIELIFTSPRIRAKETANMIKQALNRNLIVVEEIRERNHYGILSGMTKAEAKEKFPNEIEAVENYKTCATGGEDYDNFGIRVRKGITKVQDSGFNTICVITHGGVIRYVFREILKFGEINANDCAYAELDLLGKEFKIVNLDGISKKE